MFLVVSLAALLGACGEPPGWDKLIAGKIAQQYPGYQVEAAAGGSLLVRRPGRADAPVDVDGIARFCQRGPRDCDYAIDQMLIQLR